MQQTSALYRQILAMDNHWFETKVRINGTDFGESSLMSVSTSSSMFSGDPEIGKAISAEIDLSMIAPSVSIPRMAKVEPFVRIGAKLISPIRVSVDQGILKLDNGSSISNDILTINDATVEDSIVVFDRAEYETVYSEWLPKGVFYIDTRERSKNDSKLKILTIHGYDAMLFAEQDYSSTELDWPAVDISIVNEIASMMGVTVDPRTAQIMTDGNVLPLPANYSLREVLGYIASMYAGSFIMSETGELRLVTLLELPEETSYLIDNAGDAITFGGDRILV